MNPNITVMVGEFWAIWHKRNEHYQEPKITFNVEGIGGGEGIHTTVEIDEPKVTSDKNPKSVTNIKIGSVYGNNINTLMDKLEAEEFIVIDVQETENSTYTIVINDRVNILQIYEILIDAFK